MRFPAAPPKATQFNTGSFFVFKKNELKENNGLRGAVVNVCQFFVFEHFFYSSATPIIISILRTVNTFFCNKFMRSVDKYKQKRLISRVVCIYKVFGLCVRALMYIHITPHFY